MGFPSALKFKPPTRYPPTPLLQVSPPPPSTVRAAPRVLCLPTPRPRWPLLLPLLPPVGLPSFRRLLPRESLGSPGFFNSVCSCLPVSFKGTANCPAILVRSLPWVGPGSFLVSSRTVAQRVFCWLFHYGQFLNMFLSIPPFDYTVLSNVLRVVSSPLLSRLVQWSVACYFGYHMHARGPTNGRPFAIVPFFKFARCGNAAEQFREWSRIPRGAGLVNCSSGPEKQMIRSRSGRGFTEPSLPGSPRFSGPK